MKARTLLLIILVLYLVLGVWIALASAKPAPKHSSAYELGVNAALNATLQVGLEWKQMGLRPTWEQINREVARRLRVQRKEPWKK